MSIWVNYFRDSLGRCVNDSRNSDYSPFQDCVWGVAYKIEKRCEKMVRMHLDAREQAGYEVVMVRIQSGHGKDTRW